jgi:adenosylhomocysteinase
MNEVKDMALAPSGRDKIAWVRSYMPILNAVRARFEKEKPFAGMTITTSIHLEAKTAYLAQVLAAGGARVISTGCNPLSTQDDVAAALAESGVEVHARHGVTEEEYTVLLKNALAACPDLIIDDGGDLVHLMHTKYRSLIPGVIGGCEETTTGVIRLRSMQRDGELRFPMITVNNARCKYLFDNRYGTGQSAWDGVIRTTNLVVSGKHVVVAGYGWCGRGIAMRAKGYGARVIVCEVDPVKALEAMMDGFKVMPMEQAAEIGDMFVTSTGCRDVITADHFSRMKDGAVLCNAGHFNVEVDVAWLDANARERFEQRQNIIGYTLDNGRHLFVLAEGRLVNLASGDGHPAEIMDMSFAIQSLCARYLADHRDELTARVIPVPESIDDEVARRKLAACGLSIDSLTDSQREYLSSWAL